MTKEKANAFIALHQSGNPLVLFNIWDAGSAKAVAQGGARALATGSWSVAAAQGYADGEAMPLDLLVTVIRRITATTELPLSVDFESGYALKPDDVAANVGRLIEAGAVGINFEDGVDDGAKLHPIERQIACIKAIRQTADAAGVPFFINARTDYFLGESDATKHPALIDQAIARGRAYGQAGANGFFVPGLRDEALIKTACEQVALPVNIMATAKTPSIAHLGELGVARVSHGPGPYRQAMAFLADTAGKVHGAAG